MKEYIGQTDCENIYIDKYGRYIVEDRSDVCILGEYSEEKMFRSSIALSAAKDAIKEGLRLSVAEVVYK